jgi:hypothetical protein
LGPTGFPDPLVVNVSHRCALTPAPEAPNHKEPASRFVWNRIPSQCLSK